jgi:phosphoserine phosphatase
MAKPLPSWNDTPARAAIVDFVTRTTTEGSADYLEPGDRVAVFDNDGTLWTEQPMYNQGLFAFDRVRAMAADHPEWATEQPFQAVLENDMKALADAGTEGLVKIVGATHAGMTADEFAQIVRDWVATAEHPVWKRPYPATAYAPMVELLDYLRDCGYRTYIVSGGGVEFMRAFALDAYGIPPDQIIGSTIKTEFQIVDGVPVLQRLAEVDFIDDGPGKPVGIGKFLGVRPIMAFGNSDGDLQMLQYVVAGEGPRLVAILHHDDGDREVAYDRGSHVGALDEALDYAQDQNWLLISMKNDFGTVFAD